MTTVLLEKHNRQQILDLLRDDVWVVACLCAAWCDVCMAYRTSFDAFAAQHPDKQFLWIDIEDQADLVGDLDIENFPTILIQRGDDVAFFGTVQPEVRVIDRLLASYVRQSPVELHADASSSDERRTWQQDCNLRQRLSQD